MIQTTKKQFELFKKECERLIDRWGIYGWRIDFLWDSDSDDSRASISYALEGRVLAFYFPKNWTDEKTPLTDEIIIESARHETIHALSARLRLLAIERFTRESEICEANEELARIIEIAIKKGFN